MQLRVGRLDWLTGGVVRWGKFWELDCSTEVYVSRGLRAEEMLGVGMTYCLIMDGAMRRKKRSPGAEKNIK